MNVHAMPSSRSGSKNFVGCCGSKNHVGRPPGGDPKSERTRKPWLAEGVSPRTFYRRKAAVKAAASAQHDAHAAAWRGLSSFERLDRQAAARRQAIAAARRKPFDVRAIEALTARRAH